MAALPRDMITVSVGIEDRLGRKPELLDPLDHLSGFQPRIDDDTFGRISKLGNVGVFRENRVDDHR